MKAHERIVFALDVPHVSEAISLVDKLDSHVGFFKVGLELFISTWAAGVGSQRGWGPAEMLLARIPKGKLILDLKLHDIPETVERAIGAAANYGPSFITIHVQQRETLERAVRRAEKEGVKLLGVTVLTSMDVRDLDELGAADLVPWTRALKMALFAWTCGLDGFVCSPKEVKLLKQMMQPNKLDAGYPVPFLMVPGIRPAVSEESTAKGTSGPIYCGHAHEVVAECPCSERCYCRQRGNTCAEKTTTLSRRHGASQDDQKRVGKPAQAIKDGADLLVIGRPIRDAADPVAAAKAIAAEIAEASRGTEFRKISSRQKRLGFAIDQLRELGEDSEADRIQFDEGRCRLCGSLAGGDHKHRCWVEE